MAADEQEDVTIGAGTPKVCIGMPVRNGQKFIREGIGSILAQSFGRFELIISDNGSTDATQEICEEYVRNDGRIRYFRNDDDIGLHANFQRVLDLATAPYFMWACHDDLWDPSYVQKMVNVLDRREQVIVAGSNAASVDQNGVQRRWYNNAWTYSPTTTAARAYRFLSSSPGGGHATLFYGLFRTPVIKRLGYVQLGRIRRLDRGYPAADKITLFRLLFDGEFHVTEETLYFRRDVVAKPHRRRGVIASARLLPIWLQTTAVELVDVHHFYGDLRELIRASELGARQRAALVRTSMRQELRYYLDFWSTGVTRSPRRGGPEEGDRPERS